jgi:hypothetical protein
MAEEGTLKNETVRPAVAIMPQSVFRSLEHDCDSWLPYPHLPEDFSYLLKRYENEGDSFLHKTMPALGKALETSLVRKEPLIVPPGWVLRKRTQLPRHFYTYFRYVFNDDGTPLTPGKDSHNAVLLLRQIFLFWSKECSNTILGNDSAINEFLQRVTTQPHAIKCDSRVLGEAKRLLGLVFGDGKSPSVLRLHQFRKEPWGRHGPGAVAGHESGVGKWNFGVWPQTPERLFRWSDSQTNPLPRVTGIPSSRVVCVPKDYRGPRVICIEPKELQFAQQGLMEILMDVAHEHYLTRRSINFFNVERSRKMCFDTSMATIDLKDASDRLSLALVKLIFPRWVYKLLVRYRTPCVDKKRLYCFATMGSALCFPIQTLTFWALCLGTSIVHRKEYGNDHRVRVFGDDIQVPLNKAQLVCCTLTSCGLLVNPDKTCLYSDVRESCGEWVYNGFSTIIVKPKTTTISCYADWCSFMDYFKAFHELGMFEIALEYYNAALGYYQPKFRFGKNLQRSEVRVPVLVQGRRSQLNEYAGLYAWHTRSNTSPSSRGTRLRVKWKWISRDSIFLG